MSESSILNSPNAVDGQEMSTSPGLNSAPLSTIPVSAYVADVAVCASAAGFPLACHFRNFPDDIVAELFRFVGRSCGTGGVVHVSSPHAMPALDGTGSCPKLILVCPGLSLDRISWRWAARPWGSRKPWPALMTASSFPGVDCGPGPTVTLRADDNELATLERFLLEARTRDVPRNFPKSEVAFDQSRLAPLDRITNLRVRDIFSALLVGSAFLDGHATLLECGDLSQSDLDNLRRLTTSSVLQGPEDISDPLVVAMINRANVFLKAQHTERNGGSINVAKAPVPITRHLLEDLGNVAGATVMNLIAALHDHGDGLEDFKLLGWQNEFDRAREWPAGTPSEWGPHLIPWTEKLVRTRFHRLWKAGKIAGGKIKPNGPFHYVLPTSICVGHGLHSFLPDHFSLPQSKEPSGTAIASTCPPAGQAETPSEK